MAKIEFRVFSKKENSMILNGVDLNFIAEHCRDLEEYDFNDPDLIVMPSTGLLDKNGKKIYKSDFVIATFIGLMTLPIEVKYRDGRYFPLVYIKNGMISEYDPDRFEIIGNRFENPELLPDK